MAVAKQRQNFNSVTSLIDKEDKLAASMSDTKEIYQLLVSEPN